MEQELTKKGTPRKRKPKQKIYYFTKDTEEAILEFIAEDIQWKRDKIYKDRIDYAFFKLTQNIINTYKFPYMDGSIEDIQQEVIYFLLTKLPKYTQEKGAAYSYFGTIAKRYLIIENKKAYNKLKNHYNIDEDNNTDDNINKENPMINLYEEINLDEENYVLNMFVKYIRNNINHIIHNDYEENIIESILHIIERREFIDILQKKAILLYLRELTNETTPNITKVLKKLKKIYFRLNNQYLEYGYISLNY